MNFPYSADNSYMYDTLQLFQKHLCLGELYMPLITTIELLAKLITTIEKIIG